MGDRDEFNININININNANVTANGLDSSNIGFQLLKKHGWKEGTGLGSSQQGRLQPIEAYVKNNKRGLGSENLKVKSKLLHSKSAPSHANNKPEKKSKKEKALSKRMRKMLEEEKRQQEKELQRAFFREFWPDNV